MVKRSFNRICCLLLIVLSFVITLTACGKVEFKVDFVVDGQVYSSINTSGEETIKMPNDPEKEGYIFDGWYWDKDSWKKPFTANSLLDAPLSDNMSVYAKWTTIESLTGTQAEFSTFEKTGDNEYSLKVSNSTSTISLEPLVSINSRSSWSLSTDIYGNQTIASRTATLTVGDNTYYALVTAEDGSTQLYTLKIRRKPMYNVIFDTTGGTSVESQQIEEGALAVAPQTTREGYDFSAWNYDFTAPITENKTVVASWTAKQYTITYNTDGGNVANNTTTVTYDSEYTLEVPTRRGYEFLGWYLDAEKVENGTWQTASNITLLAKWDICEYTISYDLKGGSVATDNPLVYTIESDNIILTVPTRVGYTFLGWTGTDISELTMSVIIYTGSIGNKEYVANWDYDGYGITYHLDGGTNHENNPDGYNIDSANIYLENPTREGYIFSGWYTSNAFDAASKITVISTGSTGDKDLYAKWTPITYTIRFNKNASSATGTMNDQAFEYNKTQSLTSNLFARVGYTFVGWTTNADGTGTAYNNANEIFNLTATQGDIITLYAKWEANTYTVTLDRNGSNGGTNSVTATFGSAMPEATAPNPYAGYTFDGYYDENGVQYYDSTMASVKTWDKSSNTTLYAKWVANTITVTFDKQGGTNGTNAVNATFASAMPTATAPTKIGYTFAGYFTAPNGQGTKYYNESMESVRNFDIATATALYAYWTVNTYGVSFDANGGTVNQNDVTATYDAAMPSITAVPTRTGYIFLGYFDAANAGTKYYNADLSSAKAWNKTSNTMLYAHWESVKYNVVFNANGGNGTMSNQQHTYDVSANLTANAFSKTGYAFLCWNTKADGSGTKYTNNASVKNLLSASNASITLYAQWIPVDYTITYNANGGNLNENSIYGFTIKDADIALLAPTKTGYTFGGWYTDSTFENAIAAIATGTHSDIVVYAKWNVITYDITYELNGGVNNNDNVETFTIENSDIALLNPTKTGYTFDGWYTDAEFTEAITKIAAGSYENVTIYAKWNVNTYYITYELNGGTNNGGNVGTFTIESEEITLLAPSRTGYTFGGWYTDAEFTEAITKIAAGSHGGITVYAKWNIITYDITYELNGGANNNDNVETFTIENSDIALLNPTKTGYTFDGWYTDAEFTEAITKIAAGSYENVTIYAKWNVNTYYITYELNGGTNNGGNVGTFTIESEEITLLAPSRTGYTFGGWYTDAEFAEAITKIAAGSHGGITVYAKWNIITYDITYELNGGTNNGGNVGTFTIESEEITLLAPSRTGYTFGGWYTDAEFTEAITKIAAGSYENVTVYAQWTAKTVTGTLADLSTPHASYTVSFNLNGANGSIASQTVTETVGLTYPTIPTRSGYAFAGWYANSSCTGTPYDFSANVTENTTLYAKWVAMTSTTHTREYFDVMNYTSSSSAKSVTASSYSDYNYYYFTCYTSGTYKIYASRTQGDYYFQVNNITTGTQIDKYNLYGSQTSRTITFTANAGDVIRIGTIRYSVDYNMTSNGTFYVTGASYPTAGGKADGIVLVTEELTYDQNFTLDVPTKEGYNFLGWYDGVGGTGTQYTDETGASVRLWDKEVDTTLYARWEAVESIVTFDKQNGAGGSDSVTAIYDSAMPEATAPTRVGYTFMGYYTAISGGIRYYNADMTSAKVWDRTEDITLYAHWSLNPYTITFDNQGGIGETSVMVDYEAAFPAISLPIRVGYTFLGYYDEEVGGTQYYDALGVTSMSMTSAENITLYAHWEANEYTVSFNTNQGSGAQTVVTATYGEEMPEITVVPTRAGYMFLGYYDALTGGTKYYNADLTSANTWARASNTTLYAHWQGVPYYVSFNANNGTGTMATQEFEYGASEYLNSNAFTRTGYNFTGWNTEADGSGTAYNNNVSVLNLTSVSGETVTLYAQWTAKTVTGTLQDVASGTAVNVWDGTVATSFAGGNGSSSAPYIIETGAQLAYLANRVNAGVSYSGYYFELNNNIDLNNIEWTPIGKGILTSDCYTTTNAFSGVFDGNGYVICNLKISSSTTTFTGLFGCLYNSTISNLGVENASITATGISSYRCTAGILAGASNSSGRVVISKAYVTGNIVVRGNSSYLDIGSIIGDCYSATITDAYAIVDIVANSNDSGHVGGLFGYLDDSSSASKCVYIGNISGSGAEYYGAIHSNSGSGTTTYCYYNSNKTSSAATSVSTGSLNNQSCFANLNFTSTWEMGESYPILRGFEESRTFIQVELTYDQSFTLDVPTKEGYNFLGWYDGIDGTGTQYTDATGASVRVWDKEVDTTLYAKWEVIESTVTFDKQNGSGGTSSVTATYDSAMPEAAAPTRVGYTFMGYYSAISGGTKYYNADMTSARVCDFTENTTLYARWSANTYTITFDKQGGSGTSSATATYGSTLPTVSKPTKTGHAFLGYYDAAVGGTQYYDADMSSTMTWSRTEGITLYAHWEANEYTVSFNTNQGSGAQTVVTATYGEEMPEITVVPTRTGYIFLGYYDALTGGTKYYNADLTSANTWARTSNTTLYARWQGVPYYVSFNANNGTGTMATQEFEYGASEYLNGNAFTRTGYTFAGWNTAADGSGTAYANTASVLNLTSVSGETITLYAQWTAKTVTGTLADLSTPHASYTVSFNLNGASGSIASQTVTETVGLTYPTIPTRSGYVFGGWYTASSCSGTPYDFTADVTENITLYAKWVAYSGSGIIPTDGSSYQVYTTNSSYFYYAFVPLVTGTVSYNAIDWDSHNIDLCDSSKNAIGWNNQASASGTLAAGTLYYIRYKSSSGSQYITIKLTVANPTAGGKADGIMLVTEQLTYGQNFTLDVPTKEGYTFAGWYDGVGGTGTQYTDATGASVRVWDKEVDTTLYAKWEVIESTVTFDKQNGAGGSSSVTATYDSAMPEATAPTRVGYTFMGYYSAISGGTKYYNADMTSARVCDLTENTTLYARWSANTYTITFDKQGGSGTSSATATYGSSLPTISKPTKTGHTFLGYYDAAVGGTQYYDADMSSTMTWSRTEGITLYAHWEANEYTVSFNTNKGSGAQTVVTATYGEEMPEITVTPTRVGYIFLGYYDALTGGTKYYNADLTSANTWARTSNTTLYARWQGVPYYVSFNANNGTGTMAPQEFEYGASEYLNGNAFTRTGYTFAGWNTAADGSGTAYNNNVSVLNLTSVSGETVTLYAQWTAKTVTGTLDDTKELKDNVTVTFYNNGSLYSTTTLTNGQTLSYIQPTRSGYYFTGWYTDSSCTTRYNFTGTITEDMTLYAGWTSSAYTVSSSSWTSSGSTLNSTNKSDGSTGTYTITARSQIRVSFQYKVSSESGYDKLHILKNDTALITPISGSTSYVSLSVDLNSGDTLVFKYTKDGSVSNNSDCAYIYGLTYSSNVSYTSTATASCSTVVGYEYADGNTVSKEVMFDAAFTLHVPTRVGYTFLGWYDGVGGTGTQYTDATGASVRAWDKEVDTTLYAKWTPIEYNITYELNGGENSDNNPSAYNIATEDITLSAPTKAGYSFIGWTTESITVPTKNLVINMGSMGDITLTANWIEYDINDIIYNSSIKDFSIFDELNAEYFGAQCIDTDGNAVSITASFVTAPVAGETTSVLLVATSGGKTTQTIIENVKIYGTPTINVGNTTIKSTASMVASTFDATATDSFGNTLSVSVSLIEGDTATGGYRTYEFTATDRVGNEASVNTVVMVYSANDIEVVVNDVLGINVGSAGAEFGAVASDSFGDDCTVEFEVVSGNVSNAGTTVNVRFIATDVMGNTSTIAINNVKVYGTPVATMNVSEITDSTPANELYTVRDSFGVVLDASVTYVNTPVAGENVTVRIVAVDAIGNQFNTEYVLPVICTYHAIGANCTCEVCGTTEHMQGDSCICLVCGSGSHDLNVNCVCRDCGITAHSLNANCVCTACGNEFHNDNGEGTCVACGTVLNTADVWDGTIASSFARGSGTSSNPYIIETGAQLAYLASRVNAGTSFNGCYFKLDNDIDLNNINWTPIGKGTLTTSESTSICFAGVFDGNGCVIYNLKIRNTSTSFAGLFGIVTCEVKNLGVDGTNITTNISSEAHTGNIVGYLRGGRITNSYVTNCNVTSTSTYSSITGGIVGLIDGNSTVTNCYATGSLSGNGYTGGIFGATFGTNGGGTVSNVYFIGTLRNTGNVSSSYITPQIGGIGSPMSSSSSSIRNAFFVGTMSSSVSGIYMGGINGDDRGSAYNCYYSSSNSFNRSGGTSTTITNLQSESWLTSNLGWDFDNVWTFVDGYDYPVLKAFN